MTPSEDNVGVLHGKWGEEIACEHLRRCGYEIVERNARPCPWDRRYEIDIIAWDRKLDAIVFVEVKQHKMRSPFARRLQSITRRKKDLLRRACRTWLFRKRWQSSYRFDVIEIFGTPDSTAPAEIDHIPRVRLFEPEERFVDWSR